MKKVLKLLTLGLLGVMAFTTTNGVKASDATPTVDETVKGLFETYYADGVYTKDTSIYMTDDAVNESYQYFHAGSTVLNRTTYYADDALWMSRGEGSTGYSYYGTAYDGSGNEVGVTNATATTPLVAPKNAATVLSGTGKESMENYYVTMKDFKDFVHTGKWSEVDGVYTTTDATLVDNFRLFTAPCILDTTGAASNYLKFTRATVEEVNETLVMKLYVDGTDAEGKLTTTDGLFSQATLTNDNVYLTKPGEVLVSKPTIETSDYWNVYRLANASDTGWTETNVAKYGIAHGTFEDYEMFKKGSMGISGETIYPETWRVTFPAAETNSGGYYFLVVIEATNNCMVKFRDNVTVGGYFSGNSIIKKYTASSDSWSTVVSSPWLGQADIAPYLSCEYQELNIGDKLILGITNRATDAPRNLSSGTFGPEIATINRGTANTIEDIKECLLDSNNSIDLETNIKNKIKGQEDAYVRIGLLASEEELPIIPGNANAWCGFSVDTEFSVKFLGQSEVSSEVKANAWYYTYTAKRPGYIYINQQLLSWNDGSVTINYLVDDEVISTRDQETMADTTFNDKFAVYLDAGEALTYKLINNNIGTRLVTASKYMNLTFVPSATEYDLPEGYTSLTEYITAA